VKITGRFVLAAMVPLAAGMAGDLYVVVRKVTDSTRLAAGCAALGLALALGMWFGYTFYQRTGRTSRQGDGKLAHFS